MKSTDISLVFLGSGPVAAASLRSLADNFEIEAVITKPVTETEMQAAAPKAKLYPVSSRQELTDFITKQGFKSKLAVIVDFGIIVEKAVIDAFPLGIVNSHFSLLPRWRGADPISFTVLEGDTTTGVSLMLIDEQLDTGKLIAQKSLPVAENETTPSLTDKLVELSNQMLANYLPRYVSGEIKPHAQPHPDRATHSRKLTKQDSLIDWNKPAQQIEREIRAFIDWPKSRTTLGGKEVIITQAHVVDKQIKPGQLDSSDKNQPVIIGCGKDSLSIDRLKPAGKSEMSAREFLNGYKL